MADDKALEIIEKARRTGKIRKGVNEVTKVLERGIAKFVAIAKDVSPPEIVMHIPILAKDKGIPFAQVSRKEDLGAAVGIQVPTSAVAVITLGDAEKLVKDFSEGVKKAELEEEKKAETEKQPEKKEKAKETQGVSERRNSKAVSNEKKAKNEEKSEVNEETPKKEARNG